MGIARGSNAYSLANSGTGFNRLFPPPLVNGGDGRNYGVELTLEKYLSKNYYFLPTTSVFNSEYRAGDGIWRNTTYQEASARQAEVVFEEATVNSLQFRAYQRFDLRIAYHLNRPKVTHEFAIDLVDVFNTENILGLTYAPADEAQPIREENKLGRLPIFYSFLLSPPNYLVTTGRALGEEVRTWFDELLGEATELGKNTRKLRNWFFNRLRSQVAVTRQRLELQFQEEQQHGN